ncbi:hypothetical protein [Friedmanniella luteola]|uniref:hypothetical protein n=1 Tax=Friedmanniella luteola TaxID=546871 RepID=UPI000B83D7A1|nr:hypothetical protein [Friedmanniella luteola]
MLALLSVFDDRSVPAPPRYDASTWGEGRRHVYRARAGDLEVTVWNHSGTAWVGLRGLLCRRAARALATMLASTEAAEVVLNVAELTLPSASGGTPLVRLCATLSYAGYSVAVVGREDDAVVDGAEPGPEEPEPLEVLRTHRLSS